MTKGTAVAIVETLLELSKNNPAENISIKFILDTVLEIDDLSMKLKIEE